MKIEKCVPKPQPATYLLELSEREFDDLRGILEFARVELQYSSRHQNARYHDGFPMPTQRECLIVKFEAEFDKKR